MNDLMANFAVSDDVLTIRYDGLDAKSHEIDLGLLGESLRGIDRIVAVAGNFAATQRYVQHRDALNVRVLARPPQAHCFEISAILTWVSQNGLATTIVGGLTVSLVSYIFSRLSRNKEEMKQLRGALDEAIKALGNKDQAVVDRLLDTVDRMADALRPAARQVVAPIGRTASSLSISSSKYPVPPVIVGAAEKEAIETSDPAEIQPERSYTVVFHEMNIDSSSAKIALPDDPEERISAVITDPVLSIPNNPYVKAFAARTEISVQAKAAVRDGKIEKLFISNSAES
jgi:hypothetical protein